MVCVYYRTTKTHRGIGYKNKITSTSRLKCIYNNAAIYAIMMWSIFRGSVDVRFLTHSKKMV